MAAQTARRQGCGLARLGSFLDEAPLELCQVREDGEHQLPGSRRGSDGAVLERPEALPMPSSPSIKSARAVSDARAGPDARRPAYLLVSAPRCTHQSRDVVPEHLIFPEHQFVPCLIGRVQGQLQSLFAGAHPSVADLLLLAGLPSQFHQRGAKGGRR